MSRRRLLLTALVLFALALAPAVSGCSKASDGGAAPSGEAASPAPVENPAPAEEPKEPEYTSWTVYINDDDSYSQGGITYKIALNLTATNPTGDAAGKYAGNATASTSTNGTVNGQSLSTQAIANSGTLQFALEDLTAGGALAGQTTETANTTMLAGKGTITMKASGSGTIGQAGGGFSNTSGQQIDVQVQGSKVALKVNISGHTYTFDGTISGKE